VRLALENDGAIRSLVDTRDPGVDLAATIDGLALNDLAAGEAGGAALVVENAGPVSVTVRATSEAGRRHTSRVTLYRESSRVDLVNEITENFGEVRHWAFSVDLASPDVRTEETGAIVRVKKKSDGGDYANRNARYDYATLNHFVDISDGANARGVTLSNRDCSFVKLGRSTPAELDTATAQLSVLAGGQVDGEGLGIRDQNGARSFLQRFSLRPHRGYDAVAAMKFALEHQNPPVTGRVTGGDQAAYPETSYSLLTVDDPGVLLWALKPAEDGIAQGLIARLWNLSGRAAGTRIRLAPGTATARVTTHVETDLDPVAVHADGSIDARFAPHQIQTYRLTPAAPGPGRRRVREGDR
jgi:alpha-mannosidase